jgi:hypothetical protein
MNTIATNILTTRAQVMALCGISQEELNQLQWDGAMLCLEKVLQSDDHGIAELPKTTAFWMWWREQWYRRDVEFLEALKFDTDLMAYTCALPGQRMRVTIHESEMHEMYLRYHRMASDNPLVNNTQLEVSFHCMLKSFGRNH